MEKITIRPIKFRVLYKGEIHYTESIEKMLFEDGHYIEHNGAKSEFKIMQFTGIVDIDGNDIYEGDIVKYNSDDLITEYSNYENGIIKFKEGRFGVSTYMGKFEYIDCRSIKVIGNMYNFPCIDLKERSKKFRIIPTYKKDPDLEQIDNNPTYIHDLAGVIFIFILVSVAFAVAYYLFRDN